MLEHAHKWPQSTCTRYMNQKLILVPYPIHAILKSGWCLHRLPAISRIWAHLSDFLLSLTSFLMWTNTILTVVILSTYIVFWAQLSLIKPAPVDSHRSGESEICSSSAICHFEWTWFGLANSSGVIFFFLLILLELSSLGSEEGQLIWGQFFFHKSFS